MCFVFNLHLLRTHHCWTKGHFLRLCCARQLYKHAQC